MLKQCPDCLKVFPTNQKLSRHLNRKHKCTATTCPYCNVKFSRKSNYDYHVTHQVCLRKGEIMEIIANRNESKHQSYQVRSKTDEKRAEDSITNNQINQNLNKGTSDTLEEHECSSIILRKSRSQQVSIVTRPTLIVQPIITSDITQPTSSIDSSLQLRSPIRESLGSEIQGTNMDSEITTEESDHKGKHRNLDGKIDQKQCAPRARSRSRGNSQTRRAKFIYLYELIPKFQTRSEALERIKFTTPVSSSIVISKEDLETKRLVKCGRTKICPYGRQNNYTQKLTSLYEWNFKELIEYKINDNVDLDDLEDTILDSLWESEKVGLVQDDGKIIWPREVFRVESLVGVDQEVKVVINKFQTSRQTELVGLKHTQEQNKQLQLKLNLVEKLTDTGFNKDEIIDLLKFDMHLLNLSSI